MSQILEFPTQILELYTVECGCGSTKRFDLLEDEEGKEFYVQCPDCEGIIGMGLYLIED